MNFKSDQIKAIIKLIDPTENDFSKIKNRKREFELAWLHFGGKWTIK